MKSVKIKVSDNYIDLDLSEVRIGETVLVDSDRPLPRGVLSKVLKAAGMRTYGMGWVKTLPLDSIAIPRSGLPSF